MHEQAHCDEAANHQLPIAAAIIIVLHVSTDKEHRGSIPYSLFGLGGILGDGQHLSNKKHS